MRVRLMAVDGKAEGRLRHEEVAGDELEGIAGRVMVALVVARDHGALAVPVDHHLGGAQYVPGGDEPHGDAPDLQRLAIGQRLAVAEAPLPQPEAHDGQRVCRGEDGSMAGARVVRMAMGDDGAGDGPGGIDVEIARHAIETCGFGPEPGLEAG
jgi:hypothetical protein